MKKNIQPKELHDRLSSQPGARIVDVRTSFEYSSGHIPGAINIPLSSIKGDLPGIGFDEEVVVVCRSGMRSAAACAKVGQGYSQIFNLVGGTESWKSQGYPVESTPRTVMSVMRQTHLVGGILLATAFALSWAIDPNWIYLGLAPTFGLLLHATTGVCPTSVLLQKAPWNAAGEVTT